MGNVKIKNLYESDGYGWYFKNAELLKQGKLEQADIVNIAEELESMGRSEQDKLGSYLMQILLHLLKWKYQPDMRSKSWKSSIKIHRSHFERHLKKNPSLKGHMSEIVEDAYHFARLEAEKETDLPLKIFPKEMPFSLKEVLKDNWFPE